MEKVTIETYRNLEDRIRQDKNIFFTKTGLSIYLSLNPQFLRDADSQTLTGLYQWVTLTLTSLENAAKDSKKKLEIQEKIKNIGFIPYKLGGIADRVESTGDGGILVSQSLLRFAQSPPADYPQKLLAAIFEDHMASKVAGNKNNSQSQKTTISLSDEELKEITYLMIHANLLDAGLFEYEVLNLNPDLIKTSSELPKAFVEEFKGIQLNLYSDFDKIKKRVSGMLTDSLIKEVQSIKKMQSGELPLLTMSLNSEQILQAILSVCNPTLKPETKNYFLNLTTWANKTGIKFRDEQGGK